MIKKITFSLIFFSISILEAGDGWIIKATEAFRPIRHSEVIIGAEGQVYIAALGKTSISFFDKSGAFVKKFGDAGSGPGEFRGILTARYDFAAQMLYVMDVRLGRFHVFDKNGGFVQTVKMPRRAMLPFKLASGWATGTGDPKYFGMVITDEHFQNGTTLLHWEKQSDVTPINTSGGTVKITRQIGMDSAIQVINRQGDKIYIPNHDKGLVYVIDAIAKKVSHKIDIGLQPLPIAESWVSEEIARDQKETGKLPVLVEYSVAEKFPLIKDIKPGPGNQVRIFHSVHYVHEDLPPLVFDEKGQETTTPLNAFALHHIVATMGDWAYLTVYDKEREEATIIKEHLDKVNELAEIYAN